MSALAGMLRGMSISSIPTHPASPDSRTSAARTIGQVQAIRSPERPENPEHVGRAAYRREPYVRISRDAAGQGWDAAGPSHAASLSHDTGPVLDAKAVAWTRDTVLLHWVDDELAAHNVWVPAPCVRRIKRSESRWQDPYDDFAFYLEHGQLEVG